MKQIQLPSFPTDLPSTIEVRDFISDDRTYYRVVMELEATVRNDHFHMTAQCFEMNADGTFVQAPNGYPSRSNSTTHTVHKDDLGDTVEVDDDWCRHTGEVTPEMLLELPRSAGRPTDTGSSYGDLMWDESAQAGAGQAWVWREGFADSTARAKIENMQAILRTSSVRSGFAFRKGR
jgi:hypothetical protein